MSDAPRPGGFPIYASGQTSSARAVIVVQEAFGVNDHIRSVADRLSDEGFLAVAPQLFHRDGSPEVPYDDFTQAMPLMGNLTKEGITNDLNATTDFLATLGFTPANIGVVGFCMGGTVSFYAATLGTVGAAASFYGGGLATGRFGFPRSSNSRPNSSVPGSVSTVTSTRASRPSRSRSCGPSPTASPSRRRSCATPRASTAFTVTHDPTRTTKRPPRTPTSGHSRSSPSTSATKAKPASQRGVPAKTQPRSGQSDPCGHDRPSLVNFSHRGTPSPGPTRSHHG